MTSIETGGPPINFPDFDDAFAYCESFTPDPQELQALYDYCESKYGPTVYVHPQIATQTDELLDAGVRLIINANHRKMEDQYNIAASIARNALGRVIRSKPMRILAKSPYFDNDAMRQLLYKIGAIPAPRDKDLRERDDFQGEDDPRFSRLDKSRIHLTRLCVTRLKQGDNFTMFGSGERESIKGIADAQKVKKGIGHIIQTANEEDVQIAVINTGLIYTSDSPDSARLYIAPPLLELNGTPDSITTKISDNLKDAVKIAAGVLPMPKGTRRLMGR